MLCHSVGGGTGSGLGSLLLQETRDAYPRHYLTAAALCPFAAGELPLGHYNATLALSYLQEFADATVPFDNPPLLPQLTAAAAPPARPRPSGRTRAPGRPPARRGGGTASGSWSGSSRRRPAKCAFTRLVHIPVQPDLHA